jgi:putative heme degradation protein
MMDRYGGLPQSTSSQWIQPHPNNVDKLLKLPSGKTVKVIQINDFLVVEVSEWVAVASDVLKHPGKVRKPTRDGLIDFLSWFAVKGFMQMPMLF